MILQIDYLDEEHKKQQCLVTGETLDVSTDENCIVVDDTAREVTVFALRLDKLIRLKETQPEVKK